MRSPIKLDNSATSIIDTMITFDPNTYEEYVEIIRYDMRRYIKTFKVIQHWYFQKENLFTKVVGVIPIMEPLDSTGTRKELFWIPFTNNQEQQFSYLINNPHNTWVKYTSDRVEFQRATVIKGDAKKAFKNLVWESPRNNLLPVYTTLQDSYFDPPQPDNYINDNFSKITYDTLRSNAGELIIREQKPYNFQDFIAYKLRQVWYFNEKTLSLNVKILEIAPYIGIYDKDDNFKYSYPLYWVKVGNFR